MEVETTLTIEQIVAQLSEEIKGNNARLEVTRLKNLFYKTKEQLVENARASWVEAGNDLQDFALELPQEAVVKELLEESKTKRAAEIQKKEEEQERKGEEQAHCPSQNQTHTLQKYHFNTLYIIIYSIPLPSNERRGIYI